MSGNAAPRQNNWPEIGGHDIWKVTKIKVKKFGPHLVAPKITEELRKQKSYRKGWILFCKRFQTCSFMCKKKLFCFNIYVYKLKFKMVSAALFLNIITWCNIYFLPIISSVYSIICMYLLIYMYCIHIVLFWKVT